MLKCKAIYYGLFGRKERKKFVVFVQNLGLNMGLTIDLGVSDEKLDVVGETRSCCF